MIESLDSIARRELTDFVKAEALRLGFSRVGITTPDPPPHLNIYRNWLAEGRHGEMTYLGTERALRRRANPREILPECEAILVVASNYLPEHHSSSGVAAYAVGDDYHDVLVERLRQLVASVEERLGGEIKHRHYTDTGPVLERELAQRAGLGWIGKNTCVIHPEHGSYFLLAEVLLALPLVPDEPFKADHCGECTLCIEACPTQCILPDRTLDARRCISYLTIELKGAVPKSLRSQTGGWIFGCDICQEVCPWNLRFAEPTGDPSFQPRSSLQSVDPADFLQLTGDRYRSELRKSPLKRAKREGLLRNAALAAANSGDRASVPGLVRVLAEEQEAIPRSHAAWALGKLGEANALQAALETEGDPEVRKEIQAALEEAEKMGAAG